MKYLNNSFVKFLIVGITNTLITYLAYLFLLLFFKYQIAYSISYILGIAFSYILNTIIVFKSSISVKKILFYPIVYIIQYLINVALLSYFVNYVNEKIAPILIIVITIPITFLLSKFILKRRENKL
ncbi:GtrA family protein [Paenibacillus elgii]|nr:GtrA family protein [Paenibacillus elgii]